MNNEKNDLDIKMGYSKNKNSLNIAINKLRESLYTNDQTEENIDIDTIHLSLIQKREKEDINRWFKNKDTDEIMTAIYYLNSGKRPIMIGDLQVGTRYIANSKNDLDDNKYK